MTQTRPAGRELARRARQQGGRPSKFLSHFYGPKRNRRSVKFASKRSVSVYRGFPSRCTLNCNRIDTAGLLLRGVSLGRNFAEFQKTRDEGVLGKFAIARLCGHFERCGLQQNVVLGWHFKCIVIRR